MSAKVLVVDDDEDLRELLELVLQRRGYEPVFATNAISAVDVARAEGPDVILLDLGLPGGGGEGVMHALMQIPELAPVPVIIVTVKDRVDARPLLESGARCFIQKPIDVDRLVGAIEDALRGAKPDGGSAA